MTTLREVIVYIVRRRPGITDRQLTEAVTARTSATSK